MGAGIGKPAVMTDGMFASYGKEISKARGAFVSWTENTAAVEADRHLRMSGLDIQMAFVSIEHFQYTKKVDQYKAMKLYADIAERDLMYITADEHKDIKATFTAAVKYIKRRIADIDEAIRIAREVDELIDFKRTELRFAVDEEAAVNARIADLKVRLAALRSAKGGAYRFPRKMSRGYCRRTTCRQMGFTQRASCRPYKNCYRSGGRTRKNRTAA
jgi:hypothetical protein